MHQRCVLSLFSVVPVCVWCFVKGESVFASEYLVSVVAMCKVDDEINVALSVHVNVWCEFGRSRNSSAAAKCCY